MTDFSDRRREFFLDAEGLKRMLLAREDVVVLHATLGRSAPEQYLQEHIPGAVLARVESDFSAPARRMSGRRPLPLAEGITASARRWGVHGADQEIVVYDAQDGKAAARAWWVLQWYGYRHVRVFDGGIRAWHRSDLPLSSGEEPTGAVHDDIAPAVPASGFLREVGVSEIIGRSEETMLLDARRWALFSGREANGLDGTLPSGHIPGAHCAAVEAFFSEDGTLRPLPELIERLREVGIHHADQPVIAYCGGGVAAAQLSLVLAAVGARPDLFVGSWSAWAADPSLPVERF